MIARKHFAERGKPNPSGVARRRAARMSTERVLRPEPPPPACVHITTGDDSLLAAAKEISTAETTPQHLLGGAECPSGWEPCPDEPADP
jgi:hypothetical protein